MPLTWIESGNKIVNKTDENPCLCGAYILMDEDRQNTMCKWYSTVGIKCSGKK